MKFLFGLVFVCVINDLYSQDFVDKNVSLKVKVILVDSAYLMIPELKVLSDSKEIKIHTKLSYGGETDRNVDGNMYFEKIVDGSFVGMYLRAYRHNWASDDTLKTYTKKDHLSDTINVKDFMAFEPGRDYMISLSLYYYIKGKRRQILSDKFPFQIAFPPQNRKQQ